MASKKKKNNNNPNQDTLDIKANADTDKKSKISPSRLPEKH